ncbi:MAG: LacI family DNA-binding transcriptional regulator [Kineosporiaceae bacterium]
MVTIADVAKAAGVSNSTVSYVLSGKRPISPPTRERVEQSIKDLGYRPHAGARALASQRTNVIGLVVPLRDDIVVPVIMQFVTAIVTAARDYDFDVLMLTKEEGATGIDRVCASAMVDALIVMDVENHDERVPILAHCGRPVVLIGWPEEDHGLPCIDLDFAAAGRAAVDHLADLGHHDIAMVGSPAAVYERRTSFALRLLDGVNAQAQARGVRVVASPCEPTYRGVARCVDEIMRTLPGFTGVFVHNELAVTPLMSVLRQRGLRVPDDLSLVAMGPPDLTAGQQVPLTMLEIPAQQVGVQAVDMLMTMLAGSQPLPHRLLQPTLVRRQTTGRRPSYGDHQS